MLVLSRREFEALFIGSDITVTVLSIKNGQVRIGIEAPKTTNIVRSELLTPQEEDHSYKEWFTRKLVSK